MTVADRAKIIQIGPYQAVRLPEGYRFEGIEVRVSKSGRRLILKPAEQGRDAWPDGFWERFEEDGDFPVL
jgi:virulence-associated protein VagC